MPDEKEARKSGSESSGEESGSKGKDGGTKERSGTKEGSGKSRKTGSTDRSKSHDDSKKSRTSKEASGSAKEKEEGSEKSATASGTSKEATGTTRDKVKGSEKSATASETSTEVTIPIGQDSEKSATVSKLPSLSLSGSGSAATTTAAPAPGEGEEGAESVSHIYRLDESLPPPGSGQPRPAPMASPSKRIDTTKADGAAVPVQRPAPPPPVVQHLSGDDSIFNSISCMRFVLAVAVVFWLLVFLILYRIREDIPDPMPEEFNWNYVSYVLTPMTIGFLGVLFYSYTQWEKNRLDNERYRQSFLSFLKLFVLVLGVGAHLGFKRWKHKKKEELRRQPYFIGIRLITYLVIGIMGIMAAKITNKAATHGLPKLRRRF